MLRSQLRAGTLRISQESLVDRRKPLFGNLAAFGLDPVEGCAIPQLAGTKVCSNTTNPLLHIVAAKTQSLAAVPNASNHNVNMRVLRVPVFSGKVFKKYSQISYR